MQITRKRKDGGGCCCSNNNTRIYVSYALFFSGIALLMGILNVYYDDDDYNNYSVSSSITSATRNNNNIPPPASILSSSNEHGVGSSSLRGESFSSKTNEQQQTIIAQSRERVEIIPPPTKARLNKPPPPQSLLNSPNAIKNLPPCEAAYQDDLFSGTNSQSSNTAFRLDPNHPTIFSGWEPPAIQKWKNKTNFQQMFGKYTQYIKGKDVQPFKDTKNRQCKTSTAYLVDTMDRLFHKKNDTTSTTTMSSNNNKDDEMDILFFTNNIENPSFLDALSQDYYNNLPNQLTSLSSSNSNGFQVFSAMEQGSSHPFHSHDTTWLGQVSGSRLWFFLPPDTPKHIIGPKVSACDYLFGKAPLPSGTTTCVQNTGEIMYFPSRWIHATCALEPWSVGIGGQRGSPNVYDQKFEVLQPPEEKVLNVNDEQKKVIGCGVLDENDFDDNTSSSANNDAIAKENFEEPKGDVEPTVADDVKEKEWKWYNGDVGKYYDKLEQDEHAKRDPKVITSYAVHRWMGTKYSTLIHYELVRQTIYELVLDKLAPSSDDVSTTSDKLRVFDAGCGLGPGLMWFEQAEPRWELVGHTISEDQYNWIVNDLPKHKFEAKLRTYDEPLEDGSVLPFNAVYSIEAAVHSPNLKNSLQAWSKALLPGGIIVIIDDFLSVGVSPEDPDVELFRRSWIANSVHTTTEIAQWADQMGDLRLVRDRDLGSEYQIIKRNYRNKVPQLRDEQGREHQGWLGSKVRQKLMVEGKISYRLIALQKKGERVKQSDDAVSTEQQRQACDAVPAVSNSNGNDSTLSITVEPVLMSGRGNKGGEKMACISSWYCCDKGEQLWDELEQQRTERTEYLQLERELFGHYLTSFSKHLTEFYQTYPANYPNNTKTQTRGMFLDIGGTGSVAAGMKQVTSKFSHWSGPLDYMVLDSDPDAKKLTNAVVCDIDDCPEAPDCHYDVTFSHTVLEHAARPWKSFDTIARITKKGGLTMHLVPWSYQYHATPDDNYRFSHKALRTLLEDRGFEVLDVGYDICTMPENMLKNKKDEHYEKIWLTYVVGRKL